jgi:hypothetical protein
MSKIASGIVLFSLLMALSLGVAFGMSEVAVTENETMNESVNVTMNETINATMNETINATMNETINATMNETMDETVEETEVA